MRRVLETGFLIAVLGLSSAALGAVPKQEVDEFDKAWNSSAELAEPSAQAQQPSESTAESVVPAVEEVTWFAERIADRTVGSGATALWSKGTKLRAETVVNGHPVITIVNGSTYYMIDGLNGAGWAVQRHPAALDLEKKRPRPFGNEGERMLEAGAEVVRQDRVMGARCDVLRLTDQRGQREVWLTEGEPRVPLRLEIYSRQSGETATTRYLGWVRGFLTIPDPFFLPDPRYSMVEMSYEEFLKRKRAGPESMMPVLFPELLSGR